MPRILVSVLGVLALSAGGCVHVSAGRSTTASQDLADLDQARAAGAVDEAEYAAIRASIAGCAP